MDSFKVIQSERLFYIEFLALFTGRVSRKNLIKRFGVSEAAVTKDISLYTNLAPDVIRYDIKKKTYIFCSANNIYYNHDVEQSLFALSGERAISVNTKNAECLVSWVNSNIKKPQSLKLVSLITRCINLNLKMNVKYSSKSSGATEKVLSPLAIFYDGLRWYIRCFDHNYDERKGYRNYSLEGFSSIKSSGESPVSVEGDKSWNNKVIVKLGAHPKAKHPESILRDYPTTKEGIIEVELRSCTVGFFLRRWQVDCTNNLEGDSKLKQLFLMNQDELLNKGLSNYDVGK